MGGDNRREKETKKRRNKGRWEMTERDGREDK